MQEKSKEYNEKEQQVAENRSRNTLFERRENLQKHESYASERRQYDAIRNGQTDRIQSVFQITPDGTPGILSRNELRNSKNMFIAGITLFTRAAIEGGVPEETAYALSDGYIQTVEECTSKSSIEKLSQKAALRFAQEVQKSGMRHYSREIEAAVKYIHLHLHVPVTLEETAEAAGISASYLSRLFKKETGMLFVDYIQKERIEAACNMLTYSDYTAAQISEYLCFSTQSYFIKTFQKIIQEQHLQNIKNIKFRTGNNIGIKSFLIIYEDCYRSRNRTENKNISERPFMTYDVQINIFKKYKKGLTNKNKDCIVFLSNQYENRESKKSH